MKDLSQNTVFDARMMKKIIKRDFPLPEGEPPIAGPGETVVYYGGWLLREIGPMGNYTTSFHSRELRSGYYKALVPVPQSNNLWSHETDTKAGREILTKNPRIQALPAIIGATILAAYQLLMNKDPLNGARILCEEIIERKTSRIFADAISDGHISKYHPRITALGQSHYRGHISLCLRGGHVCLSDESTHWDNNKERFLGGLLEEPK